MAAADPRGRRLDSAWRVVVLTLLGVDGVISAALGAAFLSFYVGSVPLPFSALLSGLVNALLVWAGMQWTASPRVGAVALWTWLFTIAAMTFTGPGGDLVFGGPGVDQWSPIVLLALGVVPPGIVLWRRRR